MSMRNKSRLFSINFLKELVLICEMVSSVSPERTGRLHGVVGTNNAANAARPIPKSRFFWRHLPETIRLVALLEIVTASPTSSQVMGHH